MSEILCWECGDQGPIHNHHVVPKSLGGKRTIPLCLECHGKVHNADLLSMSELSVRGRRRWIAAGRPAKRKPRDGQSKPFNVRDIYARWRSWKWLKASELAKEYGVTADTLRSAIAGYHQKHGHKFPTPQSRLDALPPIKPKDEDAVEEFLSRLSSRDKKSPESFFEVCEYGWSQKGIVKEIALCYYDAATFREMDKEPRGWASLLEKSK